ncbi:MAG: ubiquitin-like domain-containing protein [Propionibacteriaceae bacterium]|nr:ubiquitin-like domain-containing protein [Propionibacteriaceae bacterium]
MAVNLSGMGLNLAFGRDVTLTIDGEPTVLSVVYGSVAEVLASQDIRLYPRDRVSPGLSELVSSEMEITVDFCRPVSLTLDGQTGTYWTFATTVAGVIDGLGLSETSLKSSLSETMYIPREGVKLTIDTGHDVSITADGMTHQVHAYGTVSKALTDMGITWNENDIITPAPATDLSGELAISLVRVEVKEIVREVATAYPVNDTADPTKPRGEVTVIVAGVKGLVKETVVQTFHDGKLVNEDIIASQVLRDPITAVTKTGSKVPDVMINVTPGSAQAIAYDQVIARGWNDSEFQCLVNLWQKESGWRWNAENRYSGAYGIPQALPGSKMASAGADWRTNPATQIKWGLGYIKNRYGTPCGGWNHFLSTGWY